MSGGPALWCGQWVNRHHKRSPGRGWRPYIQTVSSHTVLERAVTDGRQPTKEQTRRQQFKFCQETLHTRHCAHYSGNYTHHLFLTFKNLHFTEIVRISVPHNGHSRHLQLSQRLTGVCNADADISVRQRHQTFAEVHFMKVSCHKRTALKTEFNANYSKIQLVPHSKLTASTANDVTLWHSHKHTVRAACGFVYVKRTGTNSNHWALKFMQLSVLLSNCRSGARHIYHYCSNQLSQSIAQKRRPTAPSNKMRVASQTHNENG